MHTIYITSAKKVTATICFLLFITITQSAVGATINVPRDGSISFALGRAHSGDVVLLSYTGLYPISVPLNIPSGVTLRGKTTGHASSQVIFATRSYFPKNTPMITMATSTKVENIKLDARHVAETGIKAQDKHHLTVINTFIMNTRYDFSNETVAYTKDGSQSSGIYFHNCDDITIRNNIIFDIGVNKIGSSATNWFGYEKVTRGSNEYGNWFSTGTAIRVYKSQTVKILHNKINNTATGGIEIIGSRHVEVGSNLIRNVSRNRDFHRTELSDGISGYHNTHLQRTRYKYWHMAWNIHDNIIINSRNNGIHVSGRDIKLTRNKIYNSLGEGLAIGDWRGHDKINGKKVFHNDENITECSKDISISNNLISGSSRENLKISEFVRTTSRYGETTDRNYINTIKASSNHDQSGSTVLPVYHPKLYCER